MQVKNKQAKQERNTVNMSIAYKAVAATVDIENFEFSYSCIDIFRKVLIKEIRKLKYHRKLFIDFDFWKHNNRSIILCLGIGILPKKLFRKLRFISNENPALLQELSSYNKDRKIWRRYYEKIKVNNKQPNIIIENDEKEKPDFRTMEEKHVVTKTEQE